MDKKRSIGIRISRERLETLADVCDAVLGGLIPHNEQEVLLRSYLCELKQKLRCSTNEALDFHELALDDTEAMAFYKLWQLKDIGRNKYASVLVSTILSGVSDMAA